jgi:hypothetical protein
LWRSILQPRVPLSTMQAEYMAVAAAIREALWLSNRWKPLGHSGGAHFDQDGQGEYATFGPQSISLQEVQGY